MIIRVWYEGTNVGTQAGVSDHGDEVVFTVFLGGKRHPPGVHRTWKIPGNYSYVQI